MNLEEVKVDIQSVASMIGLLLTLVTLFTSELARRIGEERRREGGANEDSVRQIRVLAGTLLGTTALSMVAVSPLWIQSLRRIGDFDATVLVFMLGCLLLLPLAGWQYSIASYTQSSGG